MRAKVVKTKLNLNYFFVWKLGGGGFKPCPSVENTKKYLVEL